MKGLEPPERVMPEGDQQKAGLTQAWCDQHGSPSTS